MLKLIKTNSFNHNTWTVLTLLSIQGIFFYLIIRLNSVSFYVVLNLSFSIMFNLYQDLFCLEGNQKYPGVGENDVLEIPFLKDKEKDQSDADRLVELFIWHRGIHEKGSGDVVTAVFTLYTLSIYLSAHKQLRRHLPSPFREFSWLIV